MVTSLCLRCRLLADPRAIAFMTERRSTFYMRRCVYTMTRVGKVIACRIQPLHVRLLPSFPRTNRYRQGTSHSMEQVWFLSYPDHTSPTIVPQLACQSNWGKYTGWSRPFRLNHRETNLPAVIVGIKKNISPDEICESYKVSHFQNGSSQCRSHRLWVLDQEFPSPLHHPQPGSQGLCLFPTSRSTKGSKERQNRLALHSRLSRCEALSDSGSVLW